MTIIPMDDRDGMIWLDGALVPWREAKIHVLTHALHYASCVFEGERAYGGRVFHLRQHSARLLRSAELLGFRIPFGLDALCDATEAVVRVNGLEEAYVRPLAWRGAEQIGVSAPHTKIHLAIAAWEWPNFFSREARLQGIRMTISPWARPAPNTAPTQSKAAGLYMICTLSRHAAEDQGFDDALMLDWRGQVAEATGANVFLAIDGALHTPTPDCFLDGITRQAVMAMARERQIPVVERAILPEELGRAQEVFLTGTAAEITPVREIGPYRFTPGAMTAALLEDFARETRRAA